MIQPAFSYEPGDAHEVATEPSCPRIVIATQEQLAIAKREVIQLEDGTWSAGLHVFSRYSMEEGGTKCKCGTTRAQHQIDHKQCTAKQYKKPNRWKPVVMITRPCAIAECENTVTYRDTAGNPTKYCGTPCRKRGAAILLIKRRAEKGR